MRRTRSPAYDPEFNRQQARNTFLGLISSILLESSNIPSECVDLLIDVQSQCRDSGIPFFWLLEQPLEGEDDSVSNGMIPLEYEIVRCDWKDAPELLDFLLDRTGGNDLESVVRRACIKRGEPDANALIHHILRHMALRDCELHHKEDLKPISQGLTDYDVVLEEMKNGEGFGALFSIRDFWQAILCVKAANARKREKAIRNGIQLPTHHAMLLFDSTIHAGSSTTLAAGEGGTGVSSGSSMLVALMPETDEYGIDLEPYVSLQFIASQRSWKLDIGHNSLRISLLDGEATSVEAKATLVTPSIPSSSLFASQSQSTTRSETDVEPEFAFPHSVVYPLSGSGQHTLSVAQCFSSKDMLASEPAPAASVESEPSLANVHLPRGFDDPLMLHDKDELLLQLTVRLKSIVNDQINALGDGSIEESSSSSEGFSSIVGADGLL